MGLRSEQGPLAALDWLDESGLFVPPVSLRDWNELPRLMEICAKPTMEFREKIAAGVQGWLAKNSIHRDAARAEAVVTQIFQSLPGAPPLVAVDVLVEDPDDDGEDVPDLLMLDFVFPGGRKQSAAERGLHHEKWLQRTATKNAEVARLMEVFAPDFPDLNNPRDDVRARAEALLEAKAAFVALFREDGRMYEGPRAGRIGYAELVPDADWPTWRPVKKAEALFAAVDDLWPKKCGTYAALATELTKLGYVTLSGKPLTKASVVKVLIAARLVSGSHPPWK